MWSQFSRIVARPVVVRGGGGGGGGGVFLFCFVFRFDVFWFWYVPRKKREGGDRERGEGGEGR